MIDLPKAERCPFCGCTRIASRPKHRTYDGPENELEVECVAVCTTCKACGPMVVRNGSKAAFNAARKAWNDRVP